jgi:hypothetical protein
VTSLRFRNVDASPSDDVTTWPYEAIVTAIERGLVPDWQPLFAEIRRSPWGPVARRIEHHVHRPPTDGVEPDAASTLFRLAIEAARTDAEVRERAEVAERVRAAIARSGRTAAQFAALVGTSASRLSTYATGRVTPSAAMLVRIERLAGS